VTCNPTKCAHHHHHQKKNVCKSAKCSQYEDMEVGKKDKEVA
jgi:hypothetical protein